MSKFPLKIARYIRCYKDLVFGGRPETTDQRTKSEVCKFWKEVKQKYRHREIVEAPTPGPPPIAVTGATRWRPRA